MRFLFSILTLAVTLISGSRFCAVAADAIIPEPIAQQHGMTRPWLTQADIDHGRGRVRSMVLHDGVLYLQTDRATICAIDAQTGRQLWSKIIGQSDHFSLPPAASEDLLAVVNGTRLFVCNRFNGDVLLETEISGTPGGGPALSSKFVYVPMVTGLVQAYRLEVVGDPAKELGKISKKEMTPEEQAAAEQDRRENIRLRQEYVAPLACQSAGHALLPPVVLTQNNLEEFVAWSTDAGVLSIARIDRKEARLLTIKHELKTDAPIVSQPAYQPPDPKVHGDVGVIYATSRDGHVYAVVEKSGEVLWKFPTTEPVVEPPAVIEDRVYVPTQLGGMFCLNAKNGKQYWWAPDIMHFVAASKQRVYGEDRSGQTIVLNAKTGAQIDVLPTQRLPIKLLNTETDRLYLATETGLVQCLHEIELAKPLLYEESRRPVKEEEPEKPKLPVKKAGGGEDRPRPKATPKPKAAPKDDADAEKPAKTPKKPLKKAVKAAKDAAAGDQGAAH